jgi:photosystem II stability/assembly factor-like uncharacterized protein
VNSGDSWQKNINGIALGTDPVETGLVFRGFTIQEGDSDVVYAQAEVQTTIQGREFNRTRGRVYKTMDGGDSWQLVWSGDNLARYLIIDPTDTDLLYLSTGIFDREAFNSDCGNGIAGGVGILKSMNGGTSWHAINNGLTDLYVGALRMHPRDPDILFAAAGNNACSGGYDGKLVSNLFKTTNGGQSWTKVLGQNDIVTTVNFSPSQPDTVYAGSASAFYRSNDGGKNFTSFSNANGIWGPEGVRAGVPIDVTVDPENPDILYANNYGGGVFRSVTGASTWEVWSKGYTGAELHDVHLPSGRSDTIFTIGRSGPFFSTNQGIGWTGIANGNAHYAEWYTITNRPGDPNLLILSDEHQGVILKSTDGGKRFTEVLRHPQTNAADPNKRQGFKSIVFSPSNPQIVYAGIAKDRLTFETTTTIGTAIYKSTDGGASFSPFPSIIDGYNVNRIVVGDTDADFLCAATTNGVYLSQNGARNWTHCSSLGTRHIEALVLDPQKPDFIMAGEGFQGSGIWISHDRGQTWTGPHNAGFNSSNPYVSSLVKDPSRKDTFFASDLYSGVYQTKDNGINWKPFPDWQMSGLTFRAVKDLSANQTFMAAATQGGGIFRYRWPGKGSPPVISPLLLLLLGE